jgi:hypothetical protein
LLITWTQDQKPREEAGHAEQKLSIEWYHDVMRNSIACYIEIVKVSFTEYFGPFKQQGENKLVLM